MTVFIGGHTMNKVYALLETLTDDEIRNARDIEGVSVLRDLGLNHYKLFMYQCKYVLEKARCPRSGVCGPVPIKGDL